MPRPESALASAMNTSWPRSRVPIMAQMMIMLSDIRMVWFMPSVISGRAKGSCTFQKVWRGVQPEVTAASISSGGTWRMPWLV